MHLLWMIGALCLVGGLVYVMVTRANELFCVSIRDGQALVVRGNVPPKLWRELLTTVRMARVTRGTIRAVKSGGQARLVTSGLDAGVEQRLRNALGSAGLNAMKLGSSEGRSGSRNLGQVLGIAWLAWMFTRR